MCQNGSFDLNPHSWDSAKQSTMPLVLILFTEYALRVCQWNQGLINTLDKRFVRSLQKGGKGGSLVNTAKNYEETEVTG